MHNEGMQEPADDPIPTGDFGGQKPQSDIPFAVRRRINWGDTDTAEITYTGKFIDFGIDAMEVWYEAVLGQTWHKMKQDNLANPAVSLQYDFHSTMVVGDRFDATVYVERLGRTSLTHRIEMTKVGGPLVCTGTYTAALVRDVQSLNIKAHPFPDDWRKRIEGHVRECELRESGVRTRREVLDFWFGLPGSVERGQPREVWFARQDAGGSAFDDEIREKFTPTIEAAVAGELDHWTHSLDGTLALCILLDQFSRNIYRGTAQAFANDEKILDICKWAVDAGWHEGLDIQPKKFLLMPFQHSENLADQERGIELFAALRGSESGDKSYDSMLKHRDLIAKHGRFPHRNAALGRSNTPEEDEYLSDPEAGF